MVSAGYGYLWSFMAIILSIEMSIQQPRVMAGEMAVFHALLQEEELFCRWRAFDMVNTGYYGWFWLVMVMIYGWG